VKYLFITILSVFSFSLSAADGADTLRAQVAAWESPWRSFSSYFEYNPSATFAVPVKRFSEVGATYGMSHAGDGLHLVQEGDGASALQLHSESFQVDSKYRFFGKASFLSDQKDNVGWRDVEDYQLLSPYLVADSIGGTYKRESYSLSGGASVCLRHTEWGIRASYDGGVSYRQVDPRPRNTVSVICINPGVTYSHGNWRYGVFGEYIRYRQNVDIQVEKADRKVYFYLMQGFGIYNRQFSVLDETFTRIYKGNLYSAGLHANYSEGSQSTGVLVAFKKAVITVDESDKRTPYQLTHNEITTQLTHERELFHQTLFLKGTYTFLQTIGNETQYVPVTINTNFIVWNFATQSDRYQSKKQHAQFSALLANKDLSQFSVWEQLDGTWQDTRQNYFYPDYHQFIQDAIGSGTIGINCPLRKSTLTGSIKAGYKKVLSSSLLQDENNRITTQLILPDYTFLTSDIAFYNLNLRVGFHLSQSMMANISAGVGLQQANGRQAYSTDFHFDLNF